MPIQMDAKPLKDYAITTPWTETPHMVAVCQSLASAAIHSNDITQVFNRAVTDVSAVLNIDMVKIFLFDKETATLNLKAQFERFTADGPKPYPAQLGEAIVALVAASGKAAIFENTLEDPNFARFYDSRTNGQYPYGFLAAFPMRGKLNHAGVLVCVNHQPRELTAIESAFIEAIIGQLTVALVYFNMSQSLESAERQLRDITGEHDRESPTQAQIAAFVSCEVRTRLTSILGYVQLLQQQFLGRINSRQADALDTIASESGNLLETLVNSIEGCADILPHN